MSFSGDAIKGVGKSSSRNNHASFSGSTASRCESRLTSRIQFCTAASAMMNASLRSSYGIMPLSRNFLTAFTVTASSTALKSVGCRCQRERDSLNAIAAVCATRGSVESVNLLASSPNTVGKRTNCTGFNRRLISCQASMVASCPSANRSNTLVSTATSCGLCISAVDDVKSFVFQLAAGLVGKLVASLTRALTLSFPVNGLLFSYRRFLHAAILPRSRRKSIFELTSPR